MNKVAHYLQEHLQGEVTTSADIRKYFANDASVLEITPLAVVYPRNEDDVRKTASFCWQLAERGQLVPITPRGSGSDNTGGAIGPGLVMVTNAHMNQILHLDSKSQLASVEPGVSYDALQQTLNSHGSFLPAYPEAVYATVGGAIAKNMVGEKSIKYGATGDYVQKLRVVLANGEAIDIEPLSTKQLSQKMGLTNFEGQIYRTLDKLLEEKHDLIEESRSKFNSSRNAAGYNLFEVKNNHGFDLTPLILGSQGTLAIITEATFLAAGYNPNRNLCFISLGKLTDLAQVLAPIKKLEPSLLEMLNLAALELIWEINPSQLSGVLDDRSSQIHIIVEFDDFKENDRQKKFKALNKIVEKVGGRIIYSRDEDKDTIWKIYDSRSTILNYTKGSVRAILVAENVAVSPAQVVDFLKGAYKIYDEVGLKPAAWGHIGDGVVRFQPLLDLSKLGDRQKFFKVSDGFYKLAINLGGSIAANSEGRIRAPYLQLQYGEKLLGLMQEVKKIFDPYNILNPGVKTAKPEEIKALMRHEHNRDRYHEYLPPS